MTNGQTPEEHFEQAKTYYEQNRLEEAEAECRRALTLKPTWPIAHVLLASRPLPDRCGGTQADPANQQSFKRHIVPH